MGCDPSVECIEADEWGEQLTFSISANNNGLYTKQSNQFEIGSWIPSGYVLNGSPIVAIVNNNVALASSPQCGVVSASCGTNSSGASNGSYCSSNTWTAWYGNPADSNPLSNGWSMAGNNLCGFPCSNSSGYPWCPTNTCAGYDGYDVPVDQIPCLFFGGLGLFGVVSDQYNSPPQNPIDPFAGSQFCNPSSNLNECFVHVGDNAQSMPFYDNYCPASGFVLTPPSGCKNCGLNFKIDDRYYNDNVGNYTLTFKQGLTNATCGPLAKFTQYITGILCKSTNEVYTQIISNTSFLSYIRVILVLYIAYLGLAFVMGFLEMTHREFVIIILKFGLVLQLSATTTSWEFFNDYFFSFFVNGVGELTGILFGTGSQTSCAGSGSCTINVAGIQAFDSALAQLFSYDTTRKIMTLLTWKVYGFFYVTIIYIAILIILYVIIKAIIIFLVSFLAISTLIVLAPIFLPFILFKLTHSFFERWLGQLVSYFIQPLVVLTFAFFMVSMLINQLQFIFGYRVCWKEWFNIPVIDVAFYAWQPDYNNTTTCMLTPNALYSETQDGSLVAETYPGTNYCTQNEQTNPIPNPDQPCDPYVCSQNRYIGYPYLDPNLDIDISRINELQSGDLLSFSDLIIFMLMIWFMFEFNKLVPDLAKRLGGAGVSTQMDRAASGIGSGLANFAGNASYQALNPAYKLATGGRDLKKDAKSLRKAVLFEKPSSNEIKLEQKEAEYKKLFSEVRKDINNANIPFEEKQNKIKQLNSLKNEMADLAIGIKNDKNKPNNDPNAGNIFQRSAKIGSSVTGKLDSIGNAPGSLLLKGTAKLGRATIAMPLQVGKKAVGLAAKSTLKLGKSAKDLAQRATRKQTTDTSNQPQDKSNNNSDNNDPNT
jgi:type IV secretory pathway VirB6-like protein